MRWLPLLLAACAPLPEDGADTGTNDWLDERPGVVDDTGFVADTDTDVGEADTGGADTGADVPCTDYQVNVIGPDAPVIGDSWRLTMVCDGAVSVGPYVVRLTPVDLGTIAVNVVTFQRDGAGKVMVQTGSIRRTLDVVVAAR